ncbi:MAG: DNA methyltransferase, partial [Sulfurimicrobium sp.]|nr:DNA methyltransferase [Sulfurimicrobium sp.]
MAVENKMNEKKQRLLNLLREMFQLDQPDLDFGLYRIMHAKRGQVEAFLETEFDQLIDKVFASRGARQQAIEFGAPDPDAAPKVQQARARYEVVRLTGGEDAEIYDHLHRFFSRYYDEGDFMSLRRYGKGAAGGAETYAVPYDGSEVVLHWANKDQYYIKTTENFSHFSFDPRKALQKDERGINRQLFDEEGSSGAALKVHFRVIDAAEGAHNNVKTSDKDERYFILDDEAPIAWEGSELVIRINYQPDATKPSRAQKGKWQADRNEQTVQKVLETLAGVAGDGKALAEEYRNVLARDVPKGKDKKQALLARYLGQYTASNTMDYFIHKDLGGFLRRELDFYLKNEVLKLDDFVGGEDADVQAGGISDARLKAMQSALEIVQAIRLLSQRLIDFLTQLEDFQKKLWLKKKFVVETHYCITLDRIPEKFYPEIAVNERQREEWVTLFAIDEIEGVASYSVPLTVEFLKANPFLLLDTRFFDAAVTGNLLESIEELDSTTEGTLVHSDNFQALQALCTRYREDVKCIYIDPPYNTASSSIPYKNDYRHSSFASMMNDRVAALHPLLRKDGAMFVSIDKAERTVLEHVMDGVFGFSNRVEELIWSMNTNNSQAPNYSTNHEYVLVYAKDKPTAEQDKGMFREPKPGYKEVMELVAALNPSYPQIAVIEEEIKQLYERHKVEYRTEVEAQGLEWDDEKGNDPWKGLYNYNNAEYRDEDGNLVFEMAARDKKARIWVWQEGDASMPATKQAASTRDPDHKNWRFYKPPHPITRQQCTHPKSGWKFAYDDDEDSPDKRSFVALDRDHRIAWGPDEKKVPRLKRMLHEVETNVGKSVFADYSDGEKQTSAMFGRSGVFLAPKHADFVARFVQHAAKKDSVVLDCFGGTGSTAHAVIKLNRDDQGSRKYVTVEMGGHFDTVLKPRILKAVYSKDWRIGKPAGREGISQSIKVLRLESYEDCLNNLALNDNEGATQVATSPAFQRD